MPHISFHPKPMSARSNREIVWVFMIFPPLLVGIILAVIIGLALRADTTPTTGDICGLIWCAVVLPLIALALPAVGWQELQRRKSKSSPR